MNYELIKNELIKNKKEELDYLDYIDNIANISSNKILSETEKLEVYRTLNSYQVKLTEMFKNLFRNSCAVLSRCHVRLFVTPWTLAHQAPLSMGILQARILEWVAILFARGSSQPRDQTQASHIVGHIL